MTRPWRQYLILSLILAYAAFYQVGSITYVIDVIRQPEAYPSAPFELQMATRTIGSGPLRGDQVLSINGRPFTGAWQLTDVINRSRPGDRLSVLLSEPSGRAIEKWITVGNQRRGFGSVSGATLNICLNIVVPLVSLTLGFAAAFLRPRDRNAWLLFLLLIGFSGLVVSGWPSPWPDFTYFWEAFGSATWAIWMMLFSLYFPDRFAPDRRYPWARYLLLIPGLAMELAFTGIGWLWGHDINAALLMRPLVARLYFAQMVFQILAIAVFFTVLGARAAMEQSADDRRRLKIMRLGSSLALGPIFLVAMYSLIRDVDLFVGVPWPLEVAASCMLALFPITLGYVIVVERAMDLGFVVRQSVKYGLARGGLWLVRAASIAVAVYILSTGKKNGLSPVFLLAAVAGLVAVRRKNADRASAWLDKRFFREAYDTEVVLGELAGEVSRYLETDPLIETVARRVPAILHVPDVVVLLREGDCYRTRYSTRPGEPMSIAEGGNIAAALRRRNEPLDVDFQKPPEWIHTLNAEEIQTLDFMRTQLLLPIPGKEQMSGILSLGPKLSEQAYSTTDRRLLQAVTMQMGMALENSRLMASLAEATAHREVINRELEIAREVQERLFPQNFPKIAGIDCFGYCRPARGVGGDYYDFIELSAGRLGIAIGDVSGKGIAAALLMASLQASLRGQAMAGIHDLASLMRNVNKLVYDASQSSKYATFFYAELDLATRTLVYVNAGHNPPVILRGDQVLRLEPSGPVVGLLPGAGYVMDSCQLQPGDVFIGFTDGISEALNEQDEEWEEDRFIQAAREGAEKPAKEMIANVFREADRFTGTAKQYDDMTLLVMKLSA